MKSALWLPLFDELADPLTMVQVAGHPDQLAEVVAAVTELRQDSTAPFDFVVSLPAGVDPAPYAAAGATWWLPEIGPEAVTADHVRGVLREGPLSP